MYNLEQLVKWMKVDTVHMERNESPTLCWKSCKAKGEVGVAIGFIGVPNTLLPNGICLLMTPFDVMIIVITGSSNGFLSDNTHYDNQVWHIFSWTCGNNK